MRRRDLIGGAIALGAAGVAHAEPQGLKCVIIGDSRVGKTCALAAFTGNPLPTAYAPTVFEVTEAIDIRSKNVRLTIWDTPGAEDYDRLRLLSYPQTDVFVVALDVNSISSLENIDSKWMPELHHYAPNTPIMIVGLKTDLRGASPAIATASIGAMVRETRAAGYRECSALARTGLDDVLETACEVANGRALVEPIRFLQAAPTRPRRRRLGQ